MTEIGGCARTTGIVANATERFNGESARETPLAESAMPIAITPENRPIFPISYEATIYQRKENHSLRFFRSFHCCQVTKPRLASFTVDWFRSRRRTKPSARKFSNSEFQIHICLLNLKFLLGRVKTKKMLLVKHELDPAARWSQDAGSCTTIHWPSLYNNMTLRLEKRSLIRSKIL